MIQIILKLSQMRVYPKFPCYSNIGYLHIRLPHQSSHLTGFNFFASKELNHELF